MVEKKLAKKKILVADSSITIQKLVHLTVAEMDFETVVATDGSDALSKVRSLRPHWVIADAGLEQVDGDSLCEQIRKDPKLTETKVILLVGANETAPENRGRFAKPHGILKKPFDARALKKILEDVDDDEESTVTAVAENKLEAIASEVWSESRAAAEPVAAPKPEAVSVVSPSDLAVQAKTEIREWIDKNLPAIAEKLIKEEIARAVSGR